jgi:hypothetical protein
MAETEQETAARLGLGSPYHPYGPMAGQCPGSAEYGHGLTATTVHAGCCQTWADARADAASAQPDPGPDPGPEPEPEAS